MRKLIYNTPCNNIIWANNVCIGILSMSIVFNKAFNLIPGAAFFKRLRGDSELVVISCCTCIAMFFTTTTHSQKYTKQIRKFVHDFDFTQNYSII